ncbi:uncharacterized protein LOC130725629 isoform X2 [Lotus japonicus]|uniref:uncharacterized protein LOC130725629 isoform X2 n=1 Tax=Lotus japonicus TaxID=34305 RepID=UPI00258DA53F|nr:uncharacterized protein LOC130725629 isoform X2 [Lotus japonicus]
MRGKVKFAVFGNYVDMVKQFIATDGVGLPVVVVQFAKIKSFRGDVVVQNVMNATKILWNADIPEVALFRNGLAEHGIDVDIPLGELDDGFHHVPIDEEFLTMFPRKTISELHSTEEEGIFIVWAKIEGILDGEKWWYTSCRCHKSVSIQDGMYYCSGCATFVLEVIPRFKIKLDVSDGEENATFLLFDSDAEHILQKSCKDLVASSKGKSVNEYPAAVKEIVGNDFLFKVERSSDQGVNFDDSFKVKKICDVTTVFEMFKDKTKVLTPKKVYFQSITKVFVSEHASGSKDVDLRDNVEECSGDMSDIRGSIVSLDDISSGEGSSVVSSVKNVRSGDAITSKPAKRMRIRKVKLDL